MSHFRRAEKIFILAIRQCLSWAPNSSRHYFKMQVYDILRKKYGSSLFA